MKKVITTLLITILLSSCSSENEPDSSNVSALDFTEILSFQADSLQLDMISNNNDFYITYSADNGLNENILKYNIVTLSQQDLTHPDNSNSRQIEIVNNTIYSMSSNDIYTFDLNLNNQTFIDIASGNDNLRTTPYNDEILIISGSNVIKSFNTSTGSNLSNSSISPSGYRDRRDGEVLNDKIYMFGGANELNTSNEILTYDMQTEVWSIEQNLPYQIFESFTSNYNDKILVAGNKNSDHTSPFIGIYDLSTSTFSEYDTSTTFDNATIRGITIINDDVYVAYADMTLPMQNIISIKVVKSSLL